MTGVEFSLIHQAILHRVYGTMHKTIQNSRASSDFRDIAAESFGLGIVFHCHIGWEDVKSKCLITLARAILCISSLIKPCATWTQSA